MKKLTTITLCLLVSGASFGQKTTAPVKKTNPNKSAIAGTVVDMRKQPISGVKAFVYKKDSIAASSYTDSAGYFETNFTLPGIYNVKLVYPSDKTLLIASVPVKARTITLVDLRMTPPESDTTINYATIAPKPLTPQTPKGASKTKR